MGTFANVVSRSGCGVPDEDKEVFIQQAKAVMREGGMMAVHEMRLLGKQLYLLADPNENGERLVCHYNYLEQDTWEPAGINKNVGYIYSSKIGWSYFNHTIISSLVLEGLHTNGSALVLENGEIVKDSLYTGWINYILDEKFTRLNTNLWAAFELAHETNVEDWDNPSTWMNLWNENAAPEAAVEVLLVLDDQMTWAKLDSEDGQNGGVWKKALDDTCVSYLPIVALIVEKFHKNSRLSEDEQIANLLHVFERITNEQMPDKLDEAADRDDAETILVDYAVCVYKANMPGPVVMIIAREYGRDFWETWSSVSEAANASRYVRTCEPVPPIPTSELLKVAPEQLVYLWKHDKPVAFPQEMEAWFEDLRRSFDAYMEQDATMEFPIRRIVEVLHDADEIYYRVWAFEPFLEETMDYITDARYSVLWRLFEDMVYDTQMLETGRAKYVESSHSAESYISSDWDWKHNKARLRLCAYLALIANHELREHVFGF